jgi:hypothetical protein
MSRLIDDDARCASGEALTSGDVSMRQVERGGETSAVSLIMT